MAEGTGETRVTTGYTRVTTEVRRGRGRKQERQHDHRPPRKLYRFRKRRGDRWEVRRCADPQEDGWIEVEWLKYLSGFQRQGRQWRFAAGASTIMPKWAWRPNAWEFSHQFVYARAKEALLVPLAILIG